MGYYICQWCRLEAPRARLINTLAYFERKLEEEMPPIKEDPETDQDPAITRMLFENELTPDERWADSLFADY